MCKDLEGFIAVLLKDRKRVEKIKETFKSKAKAKNKKIRWEEPDGCLSFMKTQTSLAGILDRLDDLQSDPTPENVRRVQKAIDSLPKDKAKKYKAAINELKQSLSKALTEATDLEGTPTVREEPPVLRPPVLDESSSSLDQSSSSSLEESSVDVDEEPEPSPFDLGVERHTLALDLLKESISSNPSLSKKWQQEREIKALVTLDDKHTKMIFKENMDGGVEYLKGNVPTTESDKSCVGQKLEDFPKNEQALVGVGLDVIKEVRSKLTKGPFNNYLGLSKEVTDQHLIPEDLLNQKLQKQCPSDLLKMKDFAKLLFKVEGESLDEVSEELKELGEYIDTLEEDSKEYKACVHEYQSLKVKLKKLKKIEKLTKREDLEDWLKQTPAPGWFNIVVDAAAGIAARQAKKKKEYKDVDKQKMEMACLGRATLEMGGGVCSKMAMSTHGELTTKLPPGSQIAQVFHDFDHEFVIARVPGSRWFVVDPWPHNPVVVPFVDSSFKPKGVENFTITEIEETCKHPYGIDLDTGFDWPGIIKQAMEETDLGTVEMKGVYGHESGCDKKVDSRLKGVSTWGKG